MYINDELKHELKKVFAPVCEEKGVYLFDAIPPKKLKNATSSYASSMGSDETVIALCDSTLFRSAKEGFLLTSKRLYSKAMLEKPFAIEIGDINGISLFSLGVKPLNIHVNGTIIGSTAGIEGLTHKALCEAVRLLGGLKWLESATVEDAVSSQEIRCPSCGAASSGSAKFCEYCGADLSAARKAAVTVPDDEKRYNVMLTSIGGFDIELAELFAREHSGDFEGLVSLPYMLKNSATKAEADDIQAKVDGTEMTVIIVECK